EANSKGLFGAYFVDCNGHGSTFEDRLKTATKIADKRNAVLLPFTGEQEKETPRCFSGRNTPLSDPKPYLIKLKYGNLGNFQNFSPLPFPRA
ncbi:hypothetical protein KUCAC02_006442, partial [Chaenocephalus aceratus]